MEWSSSKLKWSTMSWGGEDGFCSLVSFCHSVLSRFWMATIGLRIRFKAAVFFSPFLAAITNHIMLGSHHSSLIFTKALVPMKDAVAVRRGHRMNSWGTPIAFAWPFKTFSRLLLKLHSFSANWVFWAFCSLMLNRCTSVDDSLLRDMMFLKGINNMHIYWKRNVVWL